MENNVPQLRFKDFNGEWEEKKLGDIAEFLDGKRKPIEQKKRAKVKGVYPYYGASGIIDYVNDYIFDEEIVLLGEDGANILSRNTRLAFIVTGKCWVNNHAHVMKAKVGYTNGFISESLERIDYKKYNTGTAQPKLNQEVCREICFSTPGIEEQTKIANFLSTLDSRITVQTEKVEILEKIKKGYMQRIFSQELRFKREDGSEYPDWEEKRLGDIAEIRTGYTPPRKEKSYFNGDVVWLSVADMKSKYLNSSKEHLADKAIKESKYVEPDTLIMSFKLSVGVLGITRVRCMTNEAIANFKWLDNITFNEYMYYYLDSHDIYQYGNNATQGISLNSGGLARICVWLPSFEEQTKIADFLSTLDNKIEVERKMLETLQGMKKGFLQKMFV